MPESYEAQMLALFNQGISLCAQWEEWAAQQFAALARGDLASLLAINAEQARLAERFFRLETEWQRIRTRHLLPAQSGLMAPGLPQDQAAGAPRDPDLQAELSARHLAFVAAAERIFAANYRNVKALNVLSLLADTVEPAAGAPMGQFYDRKGSVGQRPSAITTIDREG